MVSGTLVGVDGLDSLVPFWVRVPRALGVAPVLLGIIASVAVMVLMAVVPSPLGREFSGRCKTFGNLVQLFLARNYGKLGARHGMSSNAEAAQSLFQVIASETAPKWPNFLSLRRFRRVFTSIDSSQSLLVPLIMICRVSGKLAPLHDRSR